MQVQFPLELQFMHAHKDKKTGKTTYLAIAAMYALGADDDSSHDKYTVQEEVQENEALITELLWKKLPQKAGETEKVDSKEGPEGYINFVDLLPEDRNFWHYNGSLTYPPCTEGFNWLVLEVLRRAIIIKENAVLH